MRGKNKKKILVGLGVVVLVVVALGYGLFHGYFDKGRFETKDAQWNANGKVAIIAERSDNAALTSYIYFVLIADHLLSPSELRRSYYSKTPVFGAASSCVSVRWEDPNNLVIACKDGVVGAAHIEFQEKQSGPVTIAYKNIPTK